MTSYIPLNPAEHLHARWSRPSGYGFAAGLPIVPMAAIEAGQAAAELPLAFVRTEGGVDLVAIMAANAGENWCIAEDGRWLGGFVPALLRAYPFRLKRVGEDAQFRLSLAADQQEQGGEPLYLPSGELTPRVKAMASFLLTFENSRIQTRHACRALEEAGVLAPWKIKSRNAGGASPLEPVLRVDEEAFSAVSDEMFVKLRGAGALGIAYAQLLSISRLDLLERLRKTASWLRKQERESGGARFLERSDGDLPF